MTPPIVWSYNRKDDEKKDEMMIDYHQFSTRTMWEPSPPRKMRRRSLSQVSSKSSCATSEERALNQRYNSIDSSSGATILVKSRSHTRDEESYNSQLREDKKDDFIEDDNSSITKDYSPPKIGVSPPQAMRGSRPSPVPAVIGQYDFTWIESPNAHGEPNIRDSPRQNLFHGKSLLRSPPADHKLDTPFKAPRGGLTLANIREERNSQEELQHQRISICQTPTNMDFSTTESIQTLKKNSSHDTKPVDPHMALFGALWPDSPLTSHPTSHRTRRPIPTDPSSHNKHRRL
uniref:Uncharacterized protein n=1 Tax=Aureoumbra lagunensis TaxID=44058 RepID=A0A7S3NNA0_9STRA|mmetsp:Transcript_6306/g.8848  ORF Transcript_6306/g.8848 Transcript_6306/m.8848 type:complete len:289 (+) Transcript_6306:88-954(+)|eukprot:CAMPEP_0197290684 /NCGR_PEP_ID=MMETSP0890-20130614/8936_1 /TAXON_ID=44058 ORGANISM="Aureoumbra lagunensis, Strain CCMP1510" /NCGR_SAMPLE_ID=MMETSP0890 /ASSEMBLY_ACC=CAM_ASM_000533 /LENGTH=288 /DNA_ID=CAMNT_0042762855 /DNA_START=87 /DNA_END=953 /DNA_ORIENTATION=+